MSLEKDGSIQKSNSDFDEDYYDLVKTKVRLLRVKYAFTDEDVEDMVQEIYLGMLEGKWKKSSWIEHCIIDILRRRTGAKGSINYRQRLALKYAKSIDDEKFILKKFFEQKHPQYAYDTALEVLSQMDRIVVILTYKWGMYRNEIAHIFGVHNTSITARHKRAMRKLRESGFFDEG